MNTVGKINRPIKFWGLTPLQFGIFALVNAIMVIVSIFIHLPAIGIAILMGFISFISGILLKKLKKEHKAGNPDYLTALSVKSSTPRKIVDKSRIFNLILSEK